MWRSEKYDTVTRGYISVDKVILMGTLGIEKCCQDQQTATTVHLQENIWEKMGIVLASFYNLNVFYNTMAHTWIMFFLRKDVSKCQL